MKNDSTIIVIPARLASTRLPRKPLADICGMPMVARVLTRAKEADVADVIVACSEPEVAEAVSTYGGVPVITDPNLASGTDRVYAAVESLGKSYEIVVNLQGDLPTVDRNTLSSVVELLKQTDADMTTPGLIIENEDTDRFNSPNIVKIATSIAAGQKSGRALYFSRAPIPYGDGPKIQHLGIYAYRINALRKYTSLPQTFLEKRERLEQLRALENGMKIHVAIVDMAPIEVDTQQDLEQAREFYKHNQKMM
ncbi:MAG: 3-deoxy-manno-octulosonate cytidylyltransferase [Holosporales bacterium]|jgi:3-deoxy-manno-octulosonate cytidylyltransferase (CMP-KDO synthetase)|nr:3-deoxy-manno-octulosonate cytidylyltransferase [Holosporales bacterium]